MVNIALLGHGVVGRGVAKILIDKKDYLAGKLGRELSLKYILVRHDYDVNYKEKFVTDFSL